ncbi:hypothetical protein D3C85_555420 [compost metagenome]
MQHADLFLQGLVALVEGVQLLARLQVLLGQLVEAFGGAQQVIGQLEVACADAGQQLVGAGFFRLERLLGDGFLGQRAAFFVDQRLQFEQLLLQALDALIEQVALAAAQVLQQAVARQFLAAQQGLRIERGDFGVEQIAPLRSQRFVGFFAAFQVIVDLLNARLVVADLRLRAFRAGLRGDDQAVGIDDLLLPVVQLGVALAEQLFQLRRRRVGMALGDRRGFAVLEADQFALRFSDQARRLFELLLEVAQALFAVGLLIEQL